MLYWLTEPIWPRLWELQKRCWRFSICCHMNRPLAVSTAKLQLYQCLYQGQSDNIPNVRMRSWGVNIRLATCNWAAIPIARSRINQHAAPVAPVRSKLMSCTTLDLVTATLVKWNYLPAFSLQDHSACVVWQGHSEGICDKLCAPLVE